MARRAGPRGPLGSPGACLDWVLGDAASRAAPVPVSCCRLATEHVCYSHPNAVPQVDDERRRLLIDARVLLAQVRSCADRSLTGDYLDRARVCVARVEELSVPRVALVAVSAGSRLFVYWNWQFGYVLDIDRVPAHPTLEADLSLMQLESPYRAALAYGDALVEVSSRFAVRRAVSPALAPDFR